MQEFGQIQENVPPIQQLQEFENVGYNNDHSMDELEDDGADDGDHGFH